MLADLPTLQGIEDERRTPDQIEQFLHTVNCDVVTYEDWKRLDQFEIAQGKVQERPRVKVTALPEMMAIIHKREVAEDR